MGKDVRTQWHPALCAAMRLELQEDEAFLEYINEYNLSMKPLQMDLLIIKKLRELEIKNEIGKLFRTHNIIEYKSPDDSLNVNTYMKVVAYACLYKSQEIYVGDIELDDITITMIRDRKPIKLFRWFLRQDYEITEKYKGIYYITKEKHFPIQIIVSSRLSKENQKWLTLLRKNLEKEDANRVVLQIDKLENDAQKEYGDSVLQVAMQENEGVFKEIKEEEKKGMCQALRDLFQPELDEALEQGRELGRQLGIQHMKNSARKFFENGVSYELVRASIEGLSDSELQAIYKATCCQ